MKPMFVSLKVNREGDTYISQAVLTSLLEKAYEAGRNDTLVEYGLIPTEEEKLQCEKCKEAMARIIKNC